MTGRSMRASGAEADASAALGSDACGGGAAAGGAECAVGASINGAGALAVTWFFVVGALPGAAGLDAGRGAEASAAA